MKFLLKLGALLLLLLLGCRPAGKVNEHAANIAPLIDPAKLWTLGCLNAMGLSEMRRGRAPVILRGPYAGEALSVDHIIPRSACPELDKVIANLELMPKRMNIKKSDGIGHRQRELALKFFKAGQLSEGGYRQVADLR